MSSEELLPAVRLYLQQRSSIERDARYEMVLRIQSIFIEFRDRIREQYFATVEDLGVANYRAELILRSDPNSHAIIGSTFDPSMRERNLATLKRINPEIDALSILQEMSQQYNDRVEEVLREHGITKEQ